MLQHINNKLVKSLVFASGGAVLLFGLVHFSYAATRVEELQSQINAKSGDIAALEKEIAQYQTQITQTGKEINSLSATIKTLDLTQKKLQADISLTEKKIDSTNLNIERLGLDIGDRQNSIDLGRAALRDTLTSLSRTDDISQLESMLSSGQLSDYWKNIAVTTQFHVTVDENLADLKTQKKGLEDRRDEATAEKKKLVSLNAKLADQKQIAAASQKEKQTLLGSTKNKEADYKKLLAERVARRDAFEKELLAFQSQLKIAIDQSLLPAPGSEALIWPVDAPLVTQYFGNTDFAKANPQVYSGKGHNGIDLRAPVGTPIKSAQYGTVFGVGDTDLTCQGASFGKWVAVKHDNGLTSLYAHLSLIKVSEGQRVSAGEVIAYSGNTGYTTGPHLHFTVYASQGLTIGPLKSKVAGCGTYRVPLTSLNGYLNPLVYLPQ